MVKINKLSAVDTLTGGDQFVIYNVASGDARRAAGTAMADFVGPKVKLSALADVNAANISDTQVLSYDAASGNWVPVSQISNVTYNQGSTGAVTRTLDDKLQDYVSVKDFGAKGDGVTDDTPAFNLFFAYIRDRANFGQITPPNTVEDGAIAGYIPAGRYLCNSSINAVNIRGMGVTIHADGATIHSKATGKAALDLIGSRWITIKGLKITGDQTQTPRTGFQYGRRIVAGYSSDNFQFHRCKTDGYFSLTAVYNLASETDDHLHPEYYNSATNGYCVIIDGNNYHGATSDYTDQLLVGIQAMSNIQHTFINADIRQRGSGDTIWLGSCSQTKFINSYVVTQDSVGVVLSDDGRGFNDLVLDLHFETTGIQHCVKVEKQPTMAGVWCHLRRFTFLDHAPFAADSIFLVDAGLDRVIMHDADVSIARAGVIPTNKLSASQAKIYILGNLYGASTIINDVNLYGTLGSDNVAGIASLPNGIYTSKTQGGSFDHHGPLRPYADDTQYLGGTSNRWNRVYATSAHLGDGTAFIRFGSGSPEGIIPAVVGSLWSDTSGGSGTTLYVKESGTGNTGWIAK